MTRDTLAREVLGAARAFGADLAGVASIADLPPAEDVLWPDRARSVVVVGVVHPADRPELDWWFGRVDPPGNRVLADVVRRSCAWVEEELGLRPHHLPYHVEKGGTYLKDAAVLAGLGRIGLNNLVVTPEYGPRIRLRAFTLDADLASTGPLGSDPCASCPAPCRDACPQSAFAHQVHVPGHALAPYLPGRDGHFSRPCCGIRMAMDIEAAVEEPAPGFDAPIKIIKYCRACELSCPAGEDYRPLLSQ